MNKTILITLWIIIVVSGIFLVRNGYLRPDLEDTALDQPPTGISLDQSDITNLQVNSENHTYKEYLALGNARLESKEYEIAVNHFLRAVSEDRTAEALFGLGQAYLGSHQPQSALKTFEAAEELSPNSLDLQLGIVQAMLDLREVEKTQELLWTLEDGDSRVQYYRGIVLILLREYEQAQKVFVALTNERSNASADIKYKAQVFVDKYTTFSYYPDAETIFLQTLLAKAMTETGQHQASIPLLFDIINTKNNYRDAWIILGYAYLSSDKIQDSIDALEKAKDLDSENPETFFFLGIAYSLNNDIDKAIVHIEEAKKLGYKEREELEQRLGDLYLLKEEYEKASDSYEEVLSISPEKIDTSVRIVWLNIDKLDRPDKALEFAEQAIAQNPEEPMSFNLVGWAQVANNNFDEAKTYLETAISMKPQFDAAYLNLGLMYEKQGQINMATDYYEQAIELGKGNSIATLATKRINIINKSEEQFFQTNTINSSP